VRDASGKTMRFHESESPWLRSFSLESLKVLVVCRGPVRMEAFQIFDEMGIASYGMILSEKDSITYPRCLAPELRDFRFPENVHRVPDYMGVGQEEKLERIDEIVGIAKDHGYTHVFAGYGFMAEDAEFVEAIEKAGVGFLGPSSGVIRRAGAKDEAKKLARGLGNAVIPGVDNVSARALVKRAEDRSALEALAREHALGFAWDDAVSIEENAEALLQAGYAATVELVTVEELQIQATDECATIWKQYADNRIRFKHIGGGGGKGQRVVAKPEEIAAAVMDVLAESKAVEPGSNRNFLIELNIERTRHNEIQLVGNGKWSLSLGGRDCSVQMHEQKLVEVSLTQELLDAEIAQASGATAKKLRGDKATLDLRVHRRGLQPLLHGDEHPHPGRAHRDRAGVRHEVHQSEERRGVLRGGEPHRGHGVARPARRATRAARAGAAPHLGCRDPHQCHQSGASAPCRWADPRLDVPPTR
jgi:pyruvate carboxylase